MVSKLETFAKSNSIEYFLINFTDLLGFQRSKLVPRRAIAEMEDSGAGFAGFASYLDMSPAHSDVFGIPDPDSVMQLPWKPEVAWVASDLVMDGEPVRQAPRVVLLELLQKAHSAGFTLKSGVEAEFMLLNQGGDEISDVLDNAGKPCYDQQSLMRRYEVIAEISDYMISLGWDPYQNDHEDGNGQFEMNWNYANALITADRHAFFKFMVKSIAEKHGFRATFMPKPFLGVTGNGCHIHASVWDSKEGRNLFYDEKHELGLSRMATQFIGGLIHNAGALCAITNPTVNSYKRINAPVTGSGSTWAPNTITWSGNNRTHMIRVPDKGRFELRLPDGATNPYLLQAVILAAGLNGVEYARDPGKRMDMDMYAAGNSVKGAKKLPLYLLDALRALDRNKVLKNDLGDEFSSAYLKLKMREWDDYSHSLSPWERDNALDI